MLAAWRMSRGARAAVAQALLVLALVPSHVAYGGPPAIRIDPASFWYDRPAGAADDGTAAPGSVQRLADALDELLLRHPDDFPQPPPLETVIRGVPREALDSYAWSATIGPYACATLVDGVVFIDVGPGAFVGRDALNDAELRSFLGHELVHAYQYAHGDHERRAEEIARREVEALEWELEHLEPGVRASYREDLEFNLEMYRAMLAR